MRNKEIIAWFAGLFEGEGSFGIKDEKIANGMYLTSTDMDVLEKIKKFFGGTIFKEGRKRKEHWKQAYIWRLCKKDSLIIIKEIYPYLCSRRRARADTYLRLEKELDARRVDFKKRNLKILQLYKSGVTQGEISKLYGVHRTTITKAIGKLNGGISVEGTQ